MIRARTVVVSDPFARANVMTALAGPGAPVGVLTCRERGETVEVTFDDERTAQELVAAIVVVAARYVPAAAAPSADLAAACAAAARGLNEPALDETRVIEAYLP